MQVHLYGDLITHRWIVFIIISHLGQHWIIQRSSLNFWREGRKVQGGRILSQGTVYTVFYTIYCILPMPHSHHSIYLFVDIFIHPFTCVYKVVVNLLDYLLDITALSELEA